MIIGLDLSLRAAAACAIPDDWDHDMSKVRTCVSGYPLSKGALPAESLKRIVFITDAIVDFCRVHSATKIYVEEYAFAQGASHSREIAELGGTLKYRLFTKLSIVAEPVVASRARKLLLHRAQNHFGRDEMQILG